ncbi:MULTISPECIES: hypothetical protein [Streptomyces]|uniref:Uncharacterized protein n=1 Tax=Streptomyces yunnanensis TaxID=156453 RepID=A0ABY8ACS6_9ACTN|nr:MULTISPECIES: hypothetical protein [Streptomyces]WEB42496.1 hypothetical protein MOV08_26760 [Streptomyces yunnanensis]
MADADHDADHDRRPLPDAEDPHHKHLDLEPDSEQQALREHAPVHRIELDHVHDRMRDWADRRPAPHTIDQATAHVLNWWDRAAAGAVVREVHRRVPGSVLLDAAGESAEGLLRELLAELGVLEKCHYSFAWGRRSGGWAGTTWC